MKRFAVIGNPIAHSKSPIIHARFAEQTGVDLSYTTILSPLDGFAAQVTEFFASGGSGLNVTVPFKEQAYQLCDQLSPRAQTAQAVNTLWQQDGQLCGDNTDGLGLVRALNTLNWPLVNKTVAIIGAGGATRGVVLPLCDAGVTHITIANRTFSKAVALVDSLSSMLPSHGQLQAIDLSGLTGQFDLAINATSASLGAEALPINDGFTFLHGYEMAYGKPSQFIDLCEERGVPFSEGQGMLIGQAAESFAIWNGVTPNLALIDFSDIF